MYSAGPGYQVLALSCKGQVPYAMWVTHYRPNKPGGQAHLALPRPGMLPCTCKTVSAAVLRQGKGHS